MTSLPPQHRQTDHIGPSSLRLSADMRHRPGPDLGPILRAARTRGGFGLREAARRAGISHSYLIRLESGARCPSVIVAAELIRALSLTDAEAQVLWKDAVTDHGRSHPSRAERRW